MLHFDEHEIAKIMHAGSDANLLDGLIFNRKRQYPKLACAIPRASIWNAVYTNYMGK